MRYSTVMMLLTGQAYHLIKNHGPRTMCGRFCGSSDSDDVKEKDGILCNLHGEWFPENPKEYCKTCMKAAGVDVEKTQAAFDAKFNNQITNQ